MFACNGILFNHESPMRSTGFVTRKITEALSKIVFGQLDTLRMGNLDAERDWGHAKDYVEMQWLMMQQQVPSDYVIATGRNHTVREFILEATKNIGIQIEWTGSGQMEQGFVASIDADLFFSKTNIKPNYCPVGKKLVEVDPFYFRPNELHSLKGDASKAARDLGWVPKTTFKELVCEMVEEDLRLTRQKMGLQTTASTIFGSET